MFLFYLYILRGFEKLVIILFTVKNTPNLINLFLLLKKRNKVKMVNRLKFSHYPHTSQILKNKNKNYQRFQ